VTGAAVAADRLGRDYGGTRALDDLTLRVAAAELVGLLGPNGAGKTTAMLLLATLLRPTRGHAAIFGHDVVTARTAARRRLGLVFQDPTVDPFLTVRENLEFAAALAGLDRRQARDAIAVTLERMGLAPFADRRARELSGGWRRLADIARATLHAPSLLVLDEPTVGLDPEHRAALWHFLDALRRDRGTAVLFSTHYLAEAETADSVVLLSGGKVVDRGSPAMLMEPFGTALLEVEGPGAATLASALEQRALARLVVRTPTGSRIGLDTHREQAMELAGAMPGITRALLRQPSLEDVYFARTGASALRGPPA
jgi:ABC-2 type transport system ATP-binding protein